MRVKLGFSARLVASAAVASAVALFATGRPVSASEQAPGQQPPAVPAQTPAARPAEGPEMKITADEAVRMALENNLGVRADRLGPQISSVTVAQARGFYKPSLFSNTRTSNNTSPPDFQATGANDPSSSENISTDFGLRQQLPWGGGNFSVGMDASRNSVNYAQSFNPLLESNFTANFTQPLLRNFRIDAPRQQLLTARKNEEIAEVALRQQLTVTDRVVRNAYFDLVGAIANLEVQQESLGLARESLRSNQRRVEVGAMAQIDILEAQAEVSAREESVIVAEANIRSLEDSLRTLVLNPQQPDFWSVRLVPSERPTLTPQPIDIDAAVAAALANRTDLIQTRKRLEAAQIGVDYSRNQRLPEVNLTGSYNTVGQAGSQYRIQPGGDAQLIAQRSLQDALRDVFGNDFKFWTLALQINYPIGTSQADAALASARLQREQQQTDLQDLEIGIAAQVRDVGRRVTASLLRVDSTRRARDFAQQRFEAEQKRVNVGLSSTFQLFQAQRDLSNARQQELRAVIDYNRALIDFKAVQEVPLVGR
jgi:outer membrane protein